ncbi:8d0013a3-d305-4a02-ac70-0e914e7e9a11 [Sclerotinia trifoliorum]|uniref:8d0013a3-d305-4a02-ac70-0e914e7e9a11 n=1 Tax=Sclerotinia trifoliorum TaxID=28548 RepID=A0A8H2ZQ26_9HELO|nr:8d0013a3-d305-4a02-ac70-0e914e7e9a11 [Sclerotinia trifoliorum]
MLSPIPPIPSAFQTPVPSPPKIKIIFVLGPPGIGKGTQCALLTQTPLTHSPLTQTLPPKTLPPTIHHLSIGEILRTELSNPHSKWASIIRTNMASGRTGPPEMTVSMLKSVMEEKMKMKNVSQGEGNEGGEIVFLIDGFPRSTDRIPLFESSISPPTLVLSLSSPLHILQERLLSRAETSSRIDDGNEIIQRRFEQHVYATLPVLAHYRERGLLVEIDGSGSVEAVQEEIRRVVGRVLGL